jgi:hypothetical protein
VIWTKLARLRNHRRQPAGRESDSDLLRRALGDLHARLLAKETVTNLRDAEFKVFSQGGEDGIIQYLVQRLPESDGSFVEVGVEDYSESNTRFLLAHNNWRGLIIDGGEAHSAFVTSTGLRWRHQIETVTAFITAENVNGVIGDAGFAGDIDLLSMDIDGNDYWVLAELSVISPKVIVAEYNSLFGKEHSVTIPYSPDFRRDLVHESRLYYGASLSALTRLLREKHYRLVGTNSSGNNAFFVRSDVPTELKELTPEDAFRPTQFREARAAMGNLTYQSAPTELLRSIGDFPLIEVPSQREILIRDLYEFR